MATTMKAAQFRTIGGPLELVEIPIPNPSAHQVRIKVLACGVCHGEIAAQKGLFGAQQPRTPGHEVVGIIDQLGESVTEFKKGELVGVGWFGGHCKTCQACKEDFWASCPNGSGTGVHYDGGYAEYMVAHQDALARVPEGLSPEEAAPLMCAGSTTFNALRNSVAKPGQLVAVIGIGGLGHVAIQFAKHMGFQVAAISSGKEKEVLAKSLGAHHYMDSTDPKAVVDQLQKLGGAKLFLATAPSAKSIEDIMGGLGLGGQVIIVGGIHEPLKLNTLPMMGKRQSVLGWVGGDCRDGEDCMKFSALHNIKPMIETFSLEQANEAFDRMMASKSRFRSVLKIASV